MANLLLVALGPALIAALCLVESRVESRQKVHLNRVATVTRALQQQAAARGDDLRSLELLLRPRNELDWRMFDDLARFGLLERDDVAACAWIPRVPARHRAQYETFVEVSAYRSFRISERDGDGRLRDAGAREEHFPLHFVSPAESSGLPLGIDTASDPELEAAMERARDSAGVSVLLTSAWGRENGEAAMLVLLPVYRPHAPLDSLQGRRVALEGFLMASLLLAPEVGAAMKGSDLGELQASLSSPGRRPERPFSP
ncbi:MAG TPA: CHASE domain-containing protein, partial [Polyangia bacterium]|nr:CHASE domain-containing protein [Polyangia bacterium]